MKKDSTLYLFYENKGIEFYSKLYLALDLITRRKIKKVYLGHLRRLMFFYFKNIKKKSIFFFKDIWLDSSVLIDINYISQNCYFTIHEEESSAYNKKFSKIFSRSYIDKKYLKKINAFFLLSNKSKKLYKNLPENNFVSGNPRFFFLKALMEKGYFIKKYKKNNVLLSLSGPIFDYYKYRKFIKWNKTDYGYNLYYTKAVDYFYNRSLLKIYSEIIKNNQHINFILRPYPLDEPNLIFYKKLFKKFKNLEYSINEPIQAALSAADCLVSPPDNVSMEAVLLKKKIFIFYDKNSKLHRIKYSSALAQILPKNLFFAKYIKKDFFFKLRNQKKLKKNLYDKIYNMYGLNHNTSKIISKNISFLKQENFFNKIRFYLFNFFFRKPFEIITKILNGKPSINDYIYFEKKIKFSFSRLGLAILFITNPYRFSILKVIYKYIIGTNYSDHTSKALLGYYDTFSKSEIINFSKYYFKNNFKKLKFNINQSQTILTLELKE
jgi:hypothetical protein